MPSSSVKLHLKVVDGENLGIVRINLNEYRIFILNVKQIIVLKLLLLQEKLDLLEIV